MSKYKDSQKKFSKNKKLCKNIFLHLSFPFSKKCIPFLKVLVEFPDLPIMFTPYQSRATDLERYREQLNRSSQL